MAARKAEIRDTLIALLGAHAPLAAAILPGNRPASHDWIHAVLKAGWNDFPRLSISAGRFTHSMWASEGGEPPTFASEQLGYAGNWIVRRTLTFRIEITGRDLNGDNLDPAEEAAQDAILAGGRRLGLEYVLFCGPITVSSEQKEVIVGDMRRLQSLIFVPVVLEETVL